MLTSTPASLHGADSPRVELTPPRAYTLAPEAIELASVAGLELDYWQQQALDLWLSVREDGKWAAFEAVEIVARQNGKGGILEARALAGLFLFGEKLIMWSAHEYKTAMEAFLRVRTLVQRLIRDGVVEGDQIKVNNTNGEEGFERVDTEQRLKFIARSKSSGRGFSGDVNIIDETFAYTSAQQSALMPTMNARPNPQIIYTSSPPLDGETGEILFQLRKRADAGGDDSLGYRDWGLDGDLDNLSEIDLDDRNNWAAANPALSSSVVPLDEEVILRNRRSLNDVDFAREILGVWPRQHEGGGAIDVAQWAQLVDAMSQRDGDFALGVDIEPNRDYAAITLYGLRSDELGHCQIVDYRPGTDWIVPRMAELRKLDPVALGMGRGTYASLETEMEQYGITVPEDPDKPERGDVAVIGGMDMSAACGQLIDDVRQSAIRHLGQHQLDVAVSGARTRETGDAIAWSRKDTETQLCPIVSVTVARRSFVDRVEAVKKPKKRQPLAAWA